MSFAAFTKWRHSSSPASPGDSTTQVQARRAHKVARCILLWQCVMFQIQLHRNIGRKYVSVSKHNLPFCAKWLFCNLSHSDSIFALHVILHNFVPVTFAVCRCCSPTRFYRRLLLFSFKVFSLRLSHARRTSGKSSLTHSTTPSSTRAKYVTLCFACFIRLVCNLTSFAGCLFGIKEAKGYTSFDYMIKPYTLPVHR